MHQLLAAVQAGDVAATRILLRQRPDLVHVDQSGSDEHRAIHYAVLGRHRELTQLLMEVGSDARKGIYPHREATSAYTLAHERGYHELVAIIEQQEQARREAASCPNAMVTPAQDRLSALIRGGAADEAIALLDHDPGLLRACDRSGRTPLHAAASVLHVELVAWLVARRADASKLDLVGLSPLDLAVLGVVAERSRAARFAKVAEVLLRRGCEITPLAAVALGDTAGLRRLYDQAPQRVREACHRDGPGLLSVAVAFEHRSMLTLLLDWGMDIEERHQLTELESPVVSWGRPLWLAASYGDLGMAALLLERGADPNSNVYASGWPISHAYRRRDAALRELLMRHGAVAAPADVGLNRDVELARRWLKHASEPREDVTSYQCVTVAEELLWGAACGGEPSIVGACLEHIDRALDDPWWSGMLEQPLRLWNHSADRQPETWDRSTYGPCLQRLLDHGVDPNASRRFGQTALHYAIARGDVRGRPVMTEAERLGFVRQLLEAGARVDVRDTLLASTPLGWACRYGRLEVAKLLIDHGAAVEEPAAPPWATPLSWAKKMGFVEGAVLLRRRGARQ